MTQRIFVACLILLLPSAFATFLLRRMGYRIGRHVRFGFSLVLVDRLSLGNACVVGHFNVIYVRRLLCDKSIVIGRRNTMIGPISVRMRQEASIGNRNKILRGASPSVVDWGARFQLDRGARITSDHVVDCTRSVRIGEYSILAGSGSQVWTHGYVHAQHGPGRYRVDGAVDIGHNVYVGSRCIVNGGVNVIAGCSIGTGTVVSKSLDQPGMYVSAALRVLPAPTDPQSREDLSAVNSSTLCEPVFVKGNRSRLSQ